VAGLGAGGFLGKYRILDLIGRGGMGVVYLAEDTMLGRLVAIKVLDRDFAAGDEFEARFRQEAQTVAGLRHANIIHIHALDRIDGRLTIDMEYMEGGSLADLEETHGVGLGEAVRYTRDVLEALACCHDAGVIHRDVKPSNVLLTPDGHAMLSDFGLAKLAAEHQRQAMRASASTGFFLGTPRYAPPESWDGVAPSPAWDVYSIGAMLYEAIARRPPYDADTPFGLIKQIAERPVAPLRDIAEDVPPALSDLVADMLAKDPVARPTDAAEVLERLDGIAELKSELGHRRAPVTQRVARPPSLLGPSTAAKVKRRRVVMVALGSVGLVVIALAAILAALWPGQSTRDSDVEMKASFTDYSASHHVFTASDPATQRPWENSWILREGQPDEWFMLGTDSTCLWYVHASPEGKQGLSFEGNWAEYGDVTGRSFRHGSLSGEGKWLVPREALMLFVDGKNTQDGSRWSRSVFLERANSPPDPSALSRELASTDGIDAILYNELWSRRLSWADAVEEEWIRLGAPRGTVQFLSEDTASIQVDGRLDEAVWQRALWGSGVVAANAGQRAAEARMALAYNDDGLYIGIEFPARLQRARVQIGIQPRASIRVERSPRWWVTIGGGALVRHEYRAEGREMSWTCQWQTGESAVDGRWEAEILIPFSDVGENTAPAAGARWRLNCVLAEAQGGPTEPVAVWGDPDAKCTEYGILAVFGPHASARSQAEQTDGQAAAD